MRRSTRFSCIALATLAITSLQAAGTLSVFGRSWTVRDPADWQIKQDGGAQVLELVKNRGPLPGPRRPIQFALTPLKPYRSITLEADVQVHGRSLMIVFAYQDEAHFDYAHISCDTGIEQPVHNGIFHVYGGERVRISSQRGPAALSAPNKWHHIVLTHNAETGAVDVKVNGASIPALHAVDVSLGAGEIGLGSFDETADFKNVVIR